jgi:hypothetical protein
MPTRASLALRQADHMIRDRMGEVDMAAAPQVMADERSVLRWGGLASVIGGALFLLVFAIVITFAGPDPVGPDGPIIKFPEIRAVRTVEDGLYLCALVLWVPLYLALYRAMRRTRFAPALFGSALSILGLGVLAAGALPHIVSVRLSDLYHATDASADDRAGLVLAWQATQGLFDALLLAGLLVMAMGIIVLGSAMRGSRDVGKGIGTVSVVLGAVALIAGSAVLVDPLSLFAALGVFALIAFHLILGWKVYRLSKAATDLHTGL